MDQIVFNVRNAKGERVAFIAADPAVNVLTLVVTYATDVDLRLKAGAPVMEPPPDDGPSSFYLNFGDLVAADAVPRIKIEADGWQVQYFATPAPAFALTPTQNQTFAAKASLNIRISNFPVAGPPRTSSIAVDYYGLGALDAAPGIGSVVVQNPPRNNKKLSLNASIVSNPVAFITVDRTSPIKNTLVFQFSNPSPTDPIVGKDIQWGPNPPEFLISFLPGSPPGYGALTTLERMKDIQIGLAQVYQAGWTITKDTSGPKPFWRLRPQDHAVLGSGEAAMVEFRITDLVTELKAGLALVYVQYSNIPGYDDGYFAFQIEKRMPSPGILQFVNLTPALIRRGDPITLSWQTFDAASLTLSYAIDDQPFRRTAPGDVPFNGSYSPVPAPTETLTFNLEVFDYAGNKVQSQVTITVIQPPPVITYLVATPSVANLANGGKVTLYWRVDNTDNAKQLTLTSLDGSGNTVTETVDLLQTRRDVRVFGSGGAPFRLRVDGLSDPKYHQEMSVTVPTFEDVLTLTQAPAGTVTACASQADRLPAASQHGWLKCDGASVSKDAYPALYDAIGTTYGGNGNPSFNLPDLRGMFLRCVDDGTGRDPDSASRVMQGTGTVVGGRIGSVQQDQLKSHQHNWNHFFYWRHYSGSDIAVKQPNDSRNLQTNPRQATNNDGGGSETRPRNSYVYFLIATGA